MKKQFLLVFLGVALPYLWTRRGTRRGLSVRGKEFLFSTGILSFVLVTFALNPIYRASLQETRTTENRIQQARAAASIVANQLPSEPERVSNLLLEGSERIWERFSMFSFHLAVIDQVPETTPYRGVDRYLMLPAVAFVPRLVWPEKPTNTISENFQKSIVSGQTIFSSTPTVYGWTYWDRGIFGVAVIMLVLGMCAGITERYLADRQSNRVAAVILYTALFVSLATIQANPFWLLSGLPKIIVVAVVVAAMFRLPRLWEARQPDAGG